MSLTSVVSSSMKNPRQVRVPRVVTGRKPLSKGHVIDIQVPLATEVRFGSFPDKFGKPQHFLQFPYFKSGFKVINCFVHSDRFSWCGRVIRVEATVIEKTFEGGQKYLHIDLKLVPKAARITRQLLIVPQDQYVEVNGADVFKTPAPLNAVIVLAPLQVEKKKEESNTIGQIREILASVPAPKAEPVAVAEAKVVPEKPVSTGDARLDVYVGQGWQFTGSIIPGVEMKLWRIDAGGNRKELPFFPTPVRKRQLKRIQPSVVAQ